MARSEAEIVVIDPINDDIIITDPITNDIPTGPTGTQIIQQGPNEPINELMNPSSWNCDFTLRVLAICIGIYIGFKLIK